MAKVDWQRAKELFGEAVDLDPGDRQPLLDSLRTEDPATADEVQALLAAHEAAEGDGFLSGPGFLGGAGPLSGTGRSGGLEPFDEQVGAGPNGGDSDQSDHDELATAAGEETLVDPSGPPPAPADAATVAYDANKTEAAKTDTAEGRPGGSGDASHAATLAADSVASEPPAPSGDRTKGNFIADDYEVLEELGAGGMGVVYRAYQHSLRRSVALKIIPTRLLRSSEQVARFYLEAESAARLDHPGIVPVQEVGEHDGVHFYAMAIVEGGSLSSHVGKGERLAPRRAAEIIEQVCRAVQHAHDRAVIHRDIKPANILLTTQGHPRLTDFGLAKVADEDDGLTVTGQVMGTPSYMAPEQAQGKSHAISNRTDVYSLGATLYALLSGRPPFRGETVLATLTKVQHAAPDPLAPAVPIDLRTICEKCLAKRPDDRYESAAAVADDLRRYLDGFPISARPLAPWQRGLRWCRRNPGLAGMIGAIAATLVLATVVSTTLGIEARRQAQAAAAALAQSETNAKRLSEAIEETFIFASEDLLAEEPGMQRARRTLLVNARSYYQQLIDSGQGDPEKLADAAFMLGRVQASLGESEAARASFDQAIELQTELVVRSNPASMLRLARTHNEYARLGKSEWHGRQIDDRPVAESQAGLRRWLAEAERCKQWRSEAVAAAPDDAEAQRLHANALMNLALAKIEAASYAKEPMPDAIGEIDRLLARSQQIRRGLLDREPADGPVLRDNALGLAAMADLQTLSAARRGAADGADALRDAVRLRTQAAAAFAALPAATRSRATDWNLAVAHQLRGEGFFQLGEVADAVRAYQSMREVMRRLLTRNPGVARFRKGGARALFNLSQLAYVQGKSPLGAELMAECQDLLLEGVTLQPSGDALPVLVDMSISMADSLAEHEQLVPRAVETLEYAATQLGEIVASGADRDRIDQATRRLAERARKIRNQTLDADSA
ncbi:MAG: serine/threonine-protein kinase [Planctomycetota bacterium]